MLAEHWIFLSIHFSKNLILYPKAAIDWINKSVYWENCYKECFLFKSCLPVDFSYYKFDQTQRLYWMYNRRSHFLQLTRFVHFDRIICTSSAFLELRKNHFYFCYIMGIVVFFKCSGVLNEHINRFLVKKSNSKCCGC